MRQAPAESMAPSVRLPEVLEVLEERSAQAALHTSEAASGEAAEQVPAPAPVMEDPVATRFATAVQAMREGRDQEAESLLLAMTQDYPGISGPYVNLGLVYFRAEKNQQARAAFEQALTLNPNSAISYNHLGILSRREGDFNKALDHYTNALAINFNYANAHLNLAILLELYLDKPSDALRHYQRYYQLTGEKDEEVKRWIVELERRLNRQ